MSVDPKALEGKIKQLYPEIDQHGIDMSSHWDDVTKAWMIRLAKGGNTLETHIESQDAEDCLSGTKCVYLNTQLSRFVEAYCLRGDKSCQ
jgi:hypothetical protein